jgi:spore coat protein U-like protein
VKRWLARGTFVVIAWLLTSTSAFAQGSSCTISVTSVAFGSYDVFTTTPDDSTGTVTYRCSSSPFIIWIALSDGSSSTFNPRTMRKGGEALNYNLYRDAARTTIWGDGTGGTQAYIRFFPPENSNVNVPIYGRIPAQQDVSAGNYSDTVSAVINF